MFSPLSGITIEGMNTKYMKLRTITLRVFALIERNINHLLRIKLTRDYARIPNPNDGIQETVSIVLDSLAVSKKIEILTLLYKSERFDVNFLYNLKNVRDAFAHAIPISNKKYDFESKKVTDDLHAFEDLITKALNIAGELRSIVDNQSETKEYVKNLQEYLKNRKEKG